MIAKESGLHYNENMKTIVLLAGGKSSRMGKDKIFLPYRGTSFLEHLILRSSEVFDRVLISAGSSQHTQQIRRFLEDSGAVPQDLVGGIITDHYDSFGPAGGLMSVLEETGLEHFSVAAADMPEADMRVLAYLLERLEELCGQDLAGQDHLPEDPARPSAPAAVMLQIHPEFPEPCAAAYSRTCYDLLREAAKDGIRSPMKALGKSRILTVTEEELKRSSPVFAKLDLRQSFRNINTAEDYRLM